MIITSEYVYNNIKLNETRNIVESTKQEDEQRYGFNYHRCVKVECFAEFFDKIKNDTKNITIDHYNIIGELNKIMQSSKAMTKLIRVNQVKIIKKGKVNDKLLDTYFKNGCMPI